MTRRTGLLATIRTPGMVSFLCVAFINAMVDLGHKIIIQNTIFKIYDDAVQVSLTAIVNALILLPFVLLFTPSGFLADRFAKPRIMQWSAFAAVIITLLITLAYYQGWFLFAFALTFILAAQSAIYSPAKYGYIREALGDDNLAAGNGLIQAVTIVAILAGIFIFSVLFESRLQHQSYSDEGDLLTHIAPVGWLLVLLTLVEFIVALRLPKYIITTAQDSFRWRDYRSGKYLSYNLSQMTGNSTIWLSILALSLFWGVSQTVLATFPAFAKIVLAEHNTIVIQGLLACSGFGIIMGSIIAAIMKCQQRYALLITTGTIGQIIILFIIPQLAHTFSFAIAIIAFGLFGGLFIVPLNALIQQQAPRAKLGAILAGNNWMQNIIMSLFLLVTFVSAGAGISSGLLMHSLPVFSLLLAVLLIRQYISKRNS